ncbi:hypothetical protein [Nocardia sp. NPDC050406]|uniref:hypothetical protein n=1 Tax=Nocardia sp. NPDC050406 TaxID=3364318 RepID=UPI00378C5EB7
MSTNSSGDGRAGTALVVAVVAVVVAAAAVLYTVSRDGGETGETTANSLPAATSSAPVTTVPGALPAPTTPTTPSVFRYQPLWPFATEADAAAWQAAYREGGHQPWHLDAAATALAFTQQYLGYASLDRVVATDLRDGEAWITVGYDYPDDDKDTGLPAAVLHLARLGTGADAPWEVVGTEDRFLTLTTPRYGERIDSPIAVGGRITGVDESLDIRVHQLGASDPVGEVGQIPAGGTDMPWSASVPISASCPGTLTIAVATGGHVTEVERFAVTGVRC